MARTMNLHPDAPVFRAVITRKYRRQNDPVTAHEGPYSTAAAARARVTYWVNYLADLDIDIDGSPRGESWATGYVERGEVSWSRLG